jgi:hypothetical protein
VTILYNLSGIVEVILFFKLRQGLLLFGENDDDDVGPLMDERSPVMGAGESNGQLNNNGPRGVNLFEDEDVAP